MTKVKYDTLSGKLVFNQSVSQANPSSFHVAPQAVLNGPPATARLCARAPHLTLWPGQGPATARQGEIPRGQDQLGQNCKWPDGHA